MVSLTSTVRCWLAATLVTISSAALDAAGPRASATSRVSWVPAGSNTQAA